MPDNGDNDMTRSQCRSEGCTISEVHSETDKDGTTRTMTRSVSHHWSGGSSSMEDQLAQAKAAVAALRPGEALVFLKPLRGPATDEDFTDGGGI